MATVEIYALKDPSTMEIRYIGKANNSAKRLKSHVRDSRRRDTPVYRWIRKLASNNMTPLIEVIETCNDSDWKEAETRLIALHSKSGRLMNVAAGGDQPYCSTKQRAENGRATARKIHDNPFLKKVWELKHAVGVELRYFKNKGDKEVYNRIVGKLKIAAKQRPDLFGNFMLLEEM